MKKIKFLITTLLITAIISSIFAGCSGGNKNDTPVTTTPTAAVTATTAPTATVEPTKEVEPTIVPAPTEVPNTPTPLPTPTLIPTPTPEPTNTPIPVITVAPEAKLLDSVKMGDNVWYDLYDNNTLVVRGTGATRGFKEAKNMYFFFANEYNFPQYLLAKTIIIEEGITEIGQAALSNLLDATQITFPNSLKSLKGESLSALGYSSGNVEYIGLNPEKVDIASTAFVYCGSPENLPNSEKYTCTPTPTPAPTATPLPDPNHPKKFATKKMGDNVTFEFWDNGYLYVKGTGATYDKDWMWEGFPGETYRNTHTVIVEEGVTRLGDNICKLLTNVSYCKLPKTFESIGDCPFGSSTEPIRVECYYEEKKVTVVIPTEPEWLSIREFDDVLKKPDFYCGNYGCEIIFHE